ncbi:MAG: hypothetical protein EBT72_07350 [Flavobacteriia bacterium]|nr:hypothetical protein [Flavobacteriia bacterium]
MGWGVINGLWAIGLPDPEKSFLLGKTLRYVRVKKERGNANNIACKGRSQSNRFFFGGILQVLELL